MKSEWLEREYPLIGEDGVEKLKSANVAVVGVGGVGGYALEGIVRAGVGSITVIDGDTVSLSNINRQLIADTETVGKNKVDVACERIKRINPLCIVSSINEYVNADNCDKLFHGCDFILDCCDDTPAKIAIIEYAAKNGIKIISCMGTGNKLNPEKLTVSDISKTSVCPLARSIRKKLKEKGINHLPVVYSTEEPIVSGRVPSSVSFVPSVAGMLMAGYAISEIIK